MKYLARYRRSLGYICIALSIALALFLAYEFSPERRHSISFSTDTMLTSLWQSYAKFYIDPASHRTIDPSRDSVTTSEAESYTMLRAAWMGDKATFDESWQWTQQNLQHSDDRLFSWLYGKKADGTYGVLTDQGGDHTASDADSDIALSLALAYSRWQDPAYLAASRAIAADMWEKEVVTIDGKPYLAADNVEKTSDSATIIVNPSYFSPYAYRIFAKVDPTHPWQELVDNSYAVLADAIQSPLDAGVSAGLPPDWVLVDRATGALSAPAKDSGETTNFGYDAIRAPWRLALDWQWFKDPRDKEVLDRMSYLSGAYFRDGLLYATYAHDGTMIRTSTTTYPYKYESAALYGATVGYFMVSNPSLADTVYQDKLLYLFDADTNDWKQRLSYYDDNWAWFGLALYTGALRDLTASLPDSAFAVTAQ